MDTERCKKLVQSISKLETTEIHELFKLLHTNKCEYTRNNYGVFVNLSWLSSEMVEKIETYVAFCNKSQTEVKKYESLCDLLNRNIQEASQVTESSSEEAPTEPNPIDRKVSTGKISSSMKFYLLKKKYAKQSPFATNMKSDLKSEAVIL